MDQSRGLEKDISGSKKRAALCVVLDSVGESCKSFLPILGSPFPAQLNHPSSESVELTSLTELSTDRTESFQSVIMVVSDLRMRKVPKTKN